MNESDLQTLYTQVLALSQNIPHNQRLENADTSVTMVSPLCGSQVSVDLKLADGIIEDFGQKVRACTLGAAAASMVGDKVVGRPVSELIALRNTMHDMLKNNGPAPTGEWQQLAILEAARDLVSRHGSIMLVFDGICEALREIQDPANNSVADAKSQSSGIPNAPVKGIPDTVRA